MRIAIDISSLKSGHGARGMGVYTKNLIESVQQYDTKNSYIFITRGQKIPIDADIIHYPYFDPFLLTLPLIKRIPTVVTVHDVIPFLYPDKFPAGLRGSVTWQIQKYSLSGVKRIITVSECSKRDISAVTGFDNKRIDSIYSAPSPVYMYSSDEGQENILLKKYPLPEKYILYVGDVNWNKNIPSLLRAFADVAKKDKTINLVLVGKAFLDHTIREVREIDGLILSLGLENRILRLGYVPDVDLCVIYHHAVCLVQPSYYEGFGFPVLEAMASGCPTVVSDNSGLHEILGPSIQIDAKHIESITQGIEKALSLHASNRTDMIQKGLAWAKRFTWEKTVKGLMDSYERALH